MMDSDRERGHRRIAVILMVVLLAGAGLLLLMYPHQMEVSSDGEGAVSPVSGEGSVLDPFTFTVSPAAGWSLGTVTVDGGSADVDGTTVTVTPDILCFDTIRIHVTFVEDDPQPATRTVTVTSGTGGSVSPSGPVSVTDGHDLVLTLSPRSGYSVSHVLVDGVRHDVTGRTFTLTDVRADHTVHAVFLYTGGGGGGGQPSPPVPPATVTLMGITVSGDFDRDYIVGQAFDTSGMTVIAHYSDGSSKTISGYTVSPAVMTAGTTEVTVSYTEGGVTRTATVPVTVSPVTPVSLSVTSTMTRPEAGSGLDADDLSVTVAYSDGTSRTVSDYSVTQSLPVTLVQGANTLTVSYTEGATTVSGTLTLVAQEQGTDGGFDVMVTGRNGQALATPVHLHGYDLGRTIVQPGDSEVLELRITPRSDGDDIVLDVLEVSEGQSDGQLAGHIAVTVRDADGGLLGSRTVADLCSDGTHVLIEDNPVAGAPIMVFLEVSFPHGPDNNAAMGLSMTFRLAVVAYWGADA